MQVVRNNKIKTTPITSVLEGITRDCVIEIAKNNNFEVIEQKFTRDELYIADEVFLSGTAAEITPVREIDDRKISNGNPGKITKIIQKEYKNLVKGISNPESKYLTKIQRGNVVSYFHNNNNKRGKSF